MSIVSRGKAILADADKEYIVVDDIVPEVPSPQDKLVKPMNTDTPSSTAFYTEDGTIVVEVRTSCYSAARPSAKNYRAKMEGAKDVCECEIGD